MSRPEFIYLVGLPASGKSTYAKALSDKYGSAIVSSDAIREELYGDENIQGDPKEVFKIWHERIKEHLMAGHDVIGDSTGISRKNRMQTLRELSNIDCQKKCAIVATPWEQCVKRNQERDRVVPMDVMWKMYKSWSTPYWFEGWDHIYTYYTEKVPTYTTEDFQEDYAHLSQDNPHHTLSVGEHCSKAEDYLVDTLSEFDAEYYEDVIVATAIHDCGKPKTKVWENAKKEPTDIAHYYGPDSVGAYDSLFYSFPYGTEPLDVSILINLHMQPYAWEKSPNTEKLHRKYKDKWGDRLYRQIIMLHEADVAAH